MEIVKRLSLVFMGNKQSLSKEEFIELCQVHKFLFNPLSIRKYIQMYMNLEMPQREEVVEKNRKKMEFDEDMMDANVQFYTVAS